ncbi:hypothetical protein G7K_0457-t1 [Saitoella complicata NRRL Y-17804]|uniref:C2H2-type domain-containing protein n=1 Tax=Saitoella complicata (strain BCRC 22490 / CBS 7301 / JCM 7358 / NBRC 10748 / NRRL Y-17804) TaxID=698492 RepID=A0A0E9N8J4_SAICN|nr:hypothetical protein G7K_0457-t1 [Saitoella complicata NRRL Y-17804]
MPTRPKTAGHGDVAGPSSTTGLSVSVEKQLDFLLDVIASCDFEVEPEWDRVLLPDGIISEVAGRVLKEMLERREKERSRIVMSRSTSFQFEPGQAQITASRRENLRSAGASQQSNVAVETTPNDTTPTALRKRGRPRKLGTVEGEFGLRSASHQPDEVQMEEATPKGRKKERAHSVIAMPSASREFGLRSANRRQPNEAKVETPKTPTTSKKSLKKSEEVVVKRTSPRRVRVADATEEVQAVDIPAQEPFPIEPVAKCVPLDIDIGVYHLPVFSWQLESKPWTVPNYSLRISTLTSPPEINQLYESSIQDDFTFYPSDIHCLVYSTDVDYPTVHLVLKGESARPCGAREVTYAIQSEERLGEELERAVMAFAKKGGMELKGRIGKSDRYGKVEQLEFEMEEVVDDSSADAAPAPKRNSQQDITEIDIERYGSDDDIARDPRGRPYNKVPRLTFAIHNTSCLFDDAKFEPRMILKGVNKVPAPAPFGLIVEKTKKRWNRAGKDSMTQCYMEASGDGCMNGFMRKVVKGWGLRNRYTGVGRDIKAVMARLSGELVLPNTQDEDEDVVEVIEAPMVVDEPERPEEPEEPTSSQTAVECTDEDAMVSDENTREAGLKTLGEISVLSSVLQFPTDGSSPMIPSFPRGQQGVVHGYITAPRSLAGSVQDDNGRVDEIPALLAAVDDAPKLDVLTVNPAEMNIDCSEDRCDKDTSAACSQCACSIEWYGESIGGQPDGTWLCPGCTYTTVSMAVQTLDREQGDKRPATPTPLDAPAQTKKSRATEMSIICSFTTDDGGLCAQEFGTIIDLTHHHSLCHTGQDLTWSCDLCDAKNFIIDELVKHKEPVHGVQLPDWSCSICGDDVGAFGSPDALLEHMDAIHKEARKAGSVPDQDAADATVDIRKEETGVLARSRRTTEGTPSVATEWTCRVCGDQSEVFDDQDMMLEHVGSLHSKQPEKYLRRSPRKTASASDNPENKAAESSRPVSVQSSSHDTHDNNDNAADDEENLPRGLGAALNVFVAELPAGWRKRPAICPACRRTFSRGQHVLRHYERMHMKPARAARARALEQKQKLAHKQKLAPAAEMEGPRVTRSGAKRRALSGIESCRETVTDLERVQNHPAAANLPGGSASSRANVGGADLSSAVPIKNVNYETEERCHSIGENSAEKDLVTLRKEINLFMLSQKPKWRSKRAVCPSCGRRFMGDRLLIHHISQHIKPATMKEVRTCQARAAESHVEQLATGEHESTLSEKAEPVEPQSNEVEVEVEVGPPDLHEELHSSVSRISQLNTQLREKAMLIVNDAGSDENMESDHDVESDHTEASPEVTTSPSQHTRVSCSFCKKDYSSSYIDRHMKECAVEQDDQAIYPDDTIELLIREDQEARHASRLGLPRITECIVCRMPFRWDADRYKHMRRIHVTLETPEPRPRFAMLKNANGRFDDAEDA